MPGRNGIELLEQVRQSSPDIIRVLLTGAADKVMVDILAVLSSRVFSQAGRLRNVARELATALLRQIGAVTIPRDILKRWQEGGMLVESEVKMIRSIPRMGKALIKNIPRLENIAEAVGYQNCSFSGHATPDAPTAENIPLIACLLKVIIDYDRLVEKTGDASIAFQTLLIETRLLTNHHLFQGIHNRFVERHLLPLITSIREGGFAHFIDAGGES